MSIQVEDAPGPVTVPDPQEPDLDGVVDPAQEEGEEKEETEEEKHQKTLKRIRRQVEYYFSDDNLLTDKLLRTKMKEGENKPIPIKLIASFAKMRAFRYVDIIEAMRTSETVKVLSTNEHFKRIEPLSPELLARAKTEAKARRKAYWANRSTTSQKNSTGFEKWYCDAPITPKQYAQEREMYDPDSRISLRLTAAVHQYILARKFHSAEMSIFSSWLRYGGWEISPRQYDGKDTSELNDRDPLEQAILLSTLKIDADMDDPEEWVVDFEKVTRGYFSAYFEEAVQQKPDSVEKAVVVIDNFLKYLLHHDVCPEYKDQITATTKLLKAVEAELPGVVYLRSRVPDNFSISMSVLTGGTYFSIFGHSLPFLSAIDDDDEASRWGQDARMNVTEATNIACLGLEAYVPDLIPPSGPPEDRIASFLKRANIRMCHRMGLEVVSIERWSDEVEARYREVAMNPPTIDGKVPVISPEPVGILRCRQWFPPMFEHYDLPPGVVISGIKDTTKEYLLPLEYSRLRLAFPGMKIYGSVGIVTPAEDPTSCPKSVSDTPPLIFIDQSDNVYPTFYTTLLNDLEIANAIQSQSSHMRQKRDVVWHDPEQAQKWERDEQRVMSMAGMDDSDFDDDDDEAGGDGAGGDGATAAAAADVQGGDGGKKRKKKRKSKKAKGSDEAGAEGEGEGEGGGEGENGTAGAGEDQDEKPATGAKAGLATEAEETVARADEFNDF